MLTSVYYLADSQGFNGPDRNIRGMYEEMRHQFEYDGQVELVQCIIKDILDTVILLRLRSYRGQTLRHVSQKLERELSSRGTASLCSSTSDIPHLEHSSLTIHHPELYSRCTILASISRVTRLTKRSDRSNPPKNTQAPKTQRHVDARARLYSGLPLPAAPFSSSSSGTRSYVSLAAFGGAGACDSTCFTQV